MDRRTVACAVLLATQACNKDARTTAAVDATPVALAAQAVDAAPPAPAAPPNLIAAGEEGIFELSPDGEVQRQLSKTTEVAAPRLLPGGTQIVFVRQRKHLVRLDLRTGKEEVVAGPWGADVACENDDEPRELAVQSSDDVEVDEAGRAVCIQLHDRNENMAEIGLSVRVDLAARTFEQAFTLMDESCRPDAAQAALRCDSPEPASRPAVVAKAPPEPTFPYRFDGEHSTLVGPGGKKVAFGDFHADLVESPNRRWVVLEGNEEGADYIHFQKVLLDRQTGVLLPLPEPYPEKAAPAWPAPLTPAEIADPTRDNLARAGDYVGETPLRFIDDERLVAGQLLLHLGKRRIVLLPGEVAY